MYFRGLIHTRGVASDFLNGIGSERKLDAFGIEAGPGIA